MSSSAFAAGTGAAEQVGGEIRGSSETAGGGHRVRVGHARWAGRGIDVDGAARGTRRGRADQPVRRADVSDADRRRGERFPAVRATWETMRPAGRSTGGIPQLALAAAAQAVEQSGLLEYEGREHARGSEFTSGRGKASRIFPGSST